MEHTSCQTDATSPTNKTLNISHSNTQPAAFHANNVAIQSVFTPESLDVSDVLIQMVNESIERAIANASAIDYRTVPTNLRVDTLTIDRTAPPLYHMPNDNRPYVCIQVNGIERFPLLDTGAMVCIVGYTDRKDIDCYDARMESCPYTISTISSTQYPVTGMMWLSYKMGERTVTLPTVAVKTEKPQFIVGMTFWDAFKLKIAWNEKDQTEGLSTDTLQSESKKLVKIDTLSIHPSVISNHSSARECNDTHVQWHQDSLTASLADTSAKIADTARKKQSVREPLVENTPDVYVPLNGNEAGTYHTPPIYSR